MRLIHVAAAALNQTPFDWDQNAENIRAVFRAARAAKVDVLCLPELCITGYGCEDTFHSPALRRRALAVLSELAQHTEGLVAAVGLPVLHHNGLFNTACVLADGKIVGFVAKQNLAGEGLHYEPRWFKEWRAEARATLEVDDVDYPFGDLIFEIDGVRIGFEICEDAWVAGRPGSRLVKRGVDIILNPSASHFAFGKFPVRKGFVDEGSRAFSVTYVYSNLVGNEAGRAIYDGGSLIASAGEIVAQGPRFSFAQSGLTAVVVDVDRTRRIQSGTHSFDPELSDAAGVIELEHTFHRHEPKPQISVLPAWESGDEVKEEEFARSLALGLFDYLRKSRAKGFVVSLSGGVDSTAVACLVALMVRLGTEDLGVDGFKERLKHIALVGENEEALVGELLTCVYQGTRNSSETTRTAAREVAADLGATFHELEIDAVVDAYTSMVESALGRELTWDADDIAKQNIQARTRSPGVWMIANVKAAILLATSNRSECSVGYATMDGDTSGGLSPIAGVNKHYLRAWLRWLEGRGPGESSGFASLRYVNAQEPTAELRPLGENQTDEADLMPYDVLDAIEELMIRDKLEPAESLRSLTPRFPNWSEEHLRGWVARFYRLWCRNQWKRERYAPALHVDDQNVDPKTWCRFPILSGGYARELEALLSGDSK
jgi:NAD+ synthase (glutamine-hydrolysing)